MVLLLILAALAGLAGQPASACAAEEVVIYPARHYGQEPAFDAFTKATGIQIRMLNGDAGHLYLNVISQALGVQLEFCTVKRFDCFL